MKLGYKAGWSYKWETWDSRVCRQWVFALSWSRYPSGVFLLHLGLGKRSLHVFYTPTTSERSK